MSTLYRDEEHEAEAHEGALRGYAEQAQRFKRERDLLRLALQRIAAGPCTTPALCVAGVHSIYCSKGVAEYALKEGK